MLYGTRASDDPLYSVAVNICENCGQTCDHLIDLPTWNFKACPTCAEDAARADARDATERRSPGRESAPPSGDQEKSA